MKTRCVKCGATASLTAKQYATPGYQWHDCSASPAQELAKLRTLLRAYREACRELLSIVEDNYKTLDLRSGANNPALVRARAALEADPEAKG